MKGGLRVEFSVAKLPKLEGVCCHICTDKTSCLLGPVIRRGRYKFRGVRARHISFCGRGEKREREKIRTRRAHTAKPQGNIPQSHPSATDAFSISGVFNSPIKFINHLFQGQARNPVSPLWFSCWRAACHLHTHAHICVNAESEGVGWRHNSPDKSSLER